MIEVKHPNHSSSSILDINQSNQQKERTQETGPALKSKESTLSVCVSLVFHVIVLLSLSLHHHHHHFHLHALISVTDTFSFTHHFHCVMKEMTEKVFESLDSLSSKHDSMDNHSDSSLDDSAADDVFVARDDQR